MIEDLLRIEEHARLIGARTGEAVEIGPFVAIFGRDDDPWLSWASPRGPLGKETSLAEPIAEVAARFAERGRTFRVEYNAALWPTLAPALEWAGLVPEAELPLLATRPGAFRPRAHKDVRVRFVEATGDLAFLGSLMKRGFEAPGKIEPEEIERIRAAIAAGSRHAIAEHTGLPAASGASSPVGEVTEIAAVSTLPTMRRRGAASALVSALVAAHFDAGGTLAWATCGDAAAYGLFQEVGFVDCGLRWAWTGRPPGPPGSGSP